MIDFGIIKILSIILNKLAAFLRALREVLMSSIWEI